MAGLLSSLSMSGKTVFLTVPINRLLLLSGWCWLIKVLKVKYLNNINEQDQRLIKRITW